MVALSFHPSFRLSCDFFFQKIVKTLVFNFFALHTVSFRFRNSMMMREIVVFAVVSLMTLTLSSMSIYMSLTKNTSSNNIYVNHKDNAMGRKRRWIGFVSDTQRRLD